jgi:hypothetical protein
MNTDTVSTFAAADVGDTYVFRPRASARALMMRDRSWTHAINIMHGSPSWIGDTGIVAVVTRVTHAVYPACATSKIQLVVVNSPAGAKTTIDVSILNSATPYALYTFTVQYPASCRRVCVLSLYASLFDVARCAGFCAAVKRAWTHRTERMRMKAVLSCRMSDVVADSLARVMFPAMVA